VLSQTEYPIDADGIIDIHANEKAADAVTSAAVSKGFDYSLLPLGSKNYSRNYSTRQFNFVLSSAIDFCLDIENRLEVELMTATDPNRRLDLWDELFEVRGQRTGLEHQIPFGGRR
jgi:hypothetical protein